MAARFPAVAWVCACAVACASQDRSGIGPENIATDTERSARLTVRPAFHVGPAPDCSNWYAALRKAREWGACDLFTNTNIVKNQCQERIQSCAGGCDICPLIGPGLGPPADFEDLGTLFRDPVNRNVIHGQRGAQSSGSTVFNERLCDDISWVDVLGSTMLHEAMHRCNNGFGIADFRTSQSGCSANSLERFCTGISSPGGT